MKRSGRKSRVGERWRERGRRMLACWWHLDHEYFMSVGWAEEVGFETKSVQSLPSSSAQAPSSSGKSTVVGLDKEYSATPDENPS